ncbi:MAG: ROK family protein [Candidatus Marinimicrobia bacterium]|nr:ROK family protein [Candidatus Neomarinimicrobiota bacterium]
MNYYVGIDFGGTGIKVGIINEDGEIQIKDSFVTDPQKSGEEIVKYIAECTQKVIKDSKLPEANILGVGIGSPGLLNPETGQLKVVVNVPNMNGIYITKQLRRSSGSLCSWTTMSTPCPSGNFTTVREKRISISLP